MKSSVSACMATRCGNNSGLGFAHVIFAAAYSSSRGFVCDKLPFILSSTKFFREILYTCMTSAVVGGVPKKQTKGIK